MRLKSLTLALGLLIIFNGAAKAATIDYIFSGTGSGSLGATSFDGNYSITFVGDTATAFSYAPGSFANLVVGTFSTSSLSAVLDGPIYISSVAAPNNAIGFVQPPGFSVINAAVNGYDLATPFSLITGPVSPIADSLVAATFTTDDGNLTLDNLSTMSFEAVEPSAVPLPAALPMFLAAFAGLAFFGYQRRVRASI
jgi:hypothetical protein